MLTLITLIAIGLLSRANSECANGCSGHGRCTSYDMCVCNRNYMGNDCSERVCQFGLAHVDTPKGDLNADGKIENANYILVENNEVYPYGTTEQFPFMRDTDLQDTPQSAHYYMECSNKGSCDRSSGECQCFDGYDGAACQRASCPGYPSNTCSGHGVCRSIQQLAYDDYKNIYDLWDQKITMGCQCDKGYYGPDCSLKHCKVGVDPLYLDDSATVKYSIFDFAVITTSATSDFFDTTAPDAVSQGNAYFAVKFYDSNGEDWVTQPIPWAATCAQFTAALYALPNNVIPAGSLSCTLTTGTNAAVIQALGVHGGSTEWTKSTESDYPLSGTHQRYINYPLAFWDNLVESSYNFCPYGGLPSACTAAPSGNPPASGLSGSVLSGNIWRVKFDGNPGALRQPNIEIYLDGKRPSISSKGKLITRVWTDGQQGENLDYFGDHCDGVTVNVAFKYCGAKCTPSVGVAGKIPATDNFPYSNYYYLTGMSAIEKAKLKTCLADSDFDTSNNVEVYNWDYGSKAYPHIVKLVKTTTTFTDGGYYVALYYDNDQSTPSLDGQGYGNFKLLSPFYSNDDTTFTISADWRSTDNFEVYTTKSTLALTSNASQVVFGFGSQEIYMTNVTYDQMNDPVSFYKVHNTYDGDISCELGMNNKDKRAFITHCLNKSDIFTLLNYEYPDYNPFHINLYTAKKVYTKRYSKSVTELGELAGAQAEINSGPNSLSVHGHAYGIGYHVHTNGRRIPLAGNVTDYNSAHYGTHTIVTDLSTNWGTAIGSQPRFHVYKFFPSAASTYNYVAECSNRGICDTSSGVCTCFPGYSHDDCSQQNSLHV